MTSKLNQMRAKVSQAFDMLDSVADLIGEKTICVAAYTDGTVTARIYFYNERENALQIARKIPLAWKRVTDRGCVSYIGKNGTIEVELSGIERVKPSPNEEPLFPDLATEERKELIASV